MVADFRRRRGARVLGPSTLVLGLLLSLPFLVQGCGSDSSPQGPGDGGAAKSWSGVSDVDRVAALEKFAPRVYLAADDLDGGNSYRPSSVEWFMQYVDRVQIEGQYWLQTKVPLDHATAVQGFFHGPPDEELDQVPAYAFWIENHDEWRSYLDLVYFFFYPYNRGKTMLNSVWGNHVGDWEHVTVRINAQTLEPIALALSAHAGGETIDWADIGKTPDGHPIVYSAWGSHANYSQPGAHVYNTIQVPPLDDIQVTDRTSSAVDGVAWDTWTNLEFYDWYTRRGLDGRNWPKWMGTDFSSAASGAIWRWGNTEDTCGLCLGPLCWDFPDVCLLENGPTGPVSKGSVWNVDVLD